MCFHTKQSKSAAEVQNRFKAKIDNPAAFSPHESINGFDFPLMPIITDINPEIITHYNWGLIPSWAKDNDIRKVTLNAKIETLNEKPSFKDSINKRCLIIANGFYEWQWQDSKGKNKIKYEIGHKNEELFAFAGIYSQWINNETGLTENTFSMVTTEANPLMAEIHNIKKRMPIILKQEDEAKWLDNANYENFAIPYQTELIARKLDSDSNVQVALF